MKKSLVGAVIASLTVFLVVGVVLPGGVAEAAGPRSVVIDISDQRLYQFENGALVGTLPVSTGNDRPFRVRGRRYVGRTPRGDFRIGRKIRGTRVSSLAIGRMYYPSYFVGGFAIHGGRLPGYPASHGCVRIPMRQAVAFFNWAVRGTPVHIRD